MSRLDELIAELCPDGVEYKNLVDVADILYGYPFASSLFSEDPVGMPLVRIRDVKVGSTSTYYMGDFSNKYIIHKGDILIGMDGEFNLNKWDSDDALLNQRVCKINKKCTNNVINSFLFHVLGPIFKKIENETGGSTVKHLSSKMINSLKIPVPPLPVQEEIVRILDTFSELTAKLTAELTKRKQQYQYYRDYLLINNLKMVKKITLGDIGKVSMCKRIMKSETSLEGDVPFYKIGTFGKEPDAYISRQKYEEYKRKYSYPKKGDILISASGTIGRSVIYNGEDAYYQDSNIVWIDNDESKILNKFLYYFYQLQPWSVSTGGTIARLYNDNINKTPIPVPPLEEQERIVAILDRFDALCNDLTSGLPAEIEARKKQYAYYRDKLLTFKEAV